MRNSRNLVFHEDAQVMGRALSDVPPRQSVEVPPSGLSNIITSGGKCDHGVYIPITSPWQDHAPYCSICRPYEIAVRSGGVYKA